MDLQLNAPQKGKARFDIAHLDDAKLAENSDVVKSHSGRKKRRPLMCCDARSDVLMGSKEWLSVYGLAPNKLRNGSVSVSHPENFS